MDEKAKTVLGEAKALATEDRIRIADDSVTERYDEEIQTIYRALHRHMRGREPKRLLWVANGQPLSNVLETIEGRVTIEGICALAGASLELGIELHQSDTWEGVAKRLRARRELFQ